MGTSAPFHKICQLFSIDYHRIYNLRIFAVQHGGCSDLICGSTFWHFRFPVLYQLEQQLTDQKDKNTKQEEEMGDLQKRISALEGDLDTCQTQLEEANQKLENTEKQLANKTKNRNLLKQKLQLKLQQKKHR